MAIEVDIAKSSILGRSRLKRTAKLDEIIPLIVLVPHVQSSPEDVKATLNYFDASIFLILKGMLTLFGLLE